MREELFRDPVYDGATDPRVVIREGVWWMFYTQRRASHPDPGPGVAWVHGTRIGVACSSDGVRWTYAGTLEPDASGLSLTPGAPPMVAAGSPPAASSAPPAVTVVTHWAPAVIHDGTRWRMYLTEIDGVPDRWEGFARRIVEYVSDDLASWHRVGPPSSTPPATLSVSHLAVSHLRRTKSHLLRTLSHNVSLRRPADSHKWDMVGQAARGERSAA